MVENPTQHSHMCAKESYQREIRMLTPFSCGILLYPCIYTSTSTCIPCTKHEQRDPKLLTTPRRTSPARNWRRRGRSAATNSHLTVFCLLLRFGGLHQLFSLSLCVATYFLRGCHTPALICNFWCGAGWMAGQLSGISGDHSSIFPFLLPPPPDSWFLSQDQRDRLCQILKEGQRLGM